MSLIKYEISSLKEPFVVFFYIKEKIIEASAIRIIFRIKHEIWPRVRLSLNLFHQTLKNVGRFNPFLH